MGTKDRPIDAIVAGHVCFDVIPAMRPVEGRPLSESLAPGKLVVIGAAKTSSGGPVSNTGIALIRLGLRAELMGKIGDDIFGKGLLEALRREWADRGMVVVPGAITSYTLVIAPPDVDRIFLHNPGANDTYGADDINEDLIRRALLFHFGYPPLMKRMYDDDGAELAEVMRRAKDGGATTSLDMAMPDPNAPAGRIDWRKALERTLPHVDLYLPSVEETAFMLDRPLFERRRAEAGGAEALDRYSAEDVRGLAEECLRLGAKVVCLKFGERGVYVRSGPKERFREMGAARPADPDDWDRREIWHGAFRVPVFASATGSGDSCIAGFLAAFLRGETIERAAAIATCLGAQNVQVLDAVSGIRTWEETLAMIREGTVDVARAPDGFIPAPSGTAFLGPRDRRDPA